MFDIEGQCRTVADWLDLARQHRDSAKALAKKPSTRVQSWDHCGKAIEAILKASVMVAHQKSEWWAHGERPELYTHNLSKLASEAGVDIRSLPPNHPSSPAWAVVKTWRRHQGYNPGKMPRQVIWQMIEACFGTDGVWEWLDQNFRLSS